MKLVKTYLAVEEKEAVKTISAKYEVNSEDIVSDVMGLLKSDGRGLISRAMRFKMLAKLRKQGIAVSDIRKDMDHQYTFLSKLKGFKLFLKFCDLVRTHSLEEATDRLIALIRSIYKKERKSFCLTCTLQTQCEHGKFEAGLSGIDGAVHQDCPKNLQAVPMAGQQMMQGLNAMLSLINPATLGMLSAKMPGSTGQFMQGLAVAISGASSQKLNYFNATFTGSDMMKNMQEIVDNLTAAQLAIFDVARTIDASLQKTKGKKLIASHEPEKSVALVKMEHFQDVTKVSPSSAALPSILKSYRLGTKQLQVQQNMKVQGKKQLLHVMCDSSGSMDQEIMSNKNGFLKRGHVASALCLAVIKKAMEEKSMVFFRFFAGGPDILHKAKTMHDLIDIARKVGLGDYNGGSTDIQKAVATAFKDIQAGKDEILKAEVLLITDGQASVDSVALSKEQKKTKLHVLEITNAGRSTSESQKELKGLAETYMEINPNSVDFSKMAKVV